MAIIAIQKPQTSVTLLQQIERQGIAIESQCRNGFCGACAVKIISGSVYYPQEPIAHKQPYQILPCVCHIASSHIEIEL